MTPDEREKQTKILIQKLAEQTKERDDLQRKFSMIISNINLTRQQLCDLGYQAPTATGA
jgi:hypothetical protein